MIGLFCRRALQTRTYSAKATYNFKEPTNHSHPIAFQAYPLHIYVCAHVHMYISIYVLIFQKCLKAGPGSNVRIAVLFSICVSVYISKMGGGVYLRKTNVTYRIQIVRRPYLCCVPTKRCGVNPKYWHVATLECAICVGFCVQGRLPTRRAGCVCKRNTHIYIFV